MGVVTQFNSCIFIDNARIQVERWNVEHVGEHGLGPDEAEYVVNHARPPYPRYEGDGRYRVLGQSAAGRYLQVVFIFDPPGVVYIIHARPLTEHEKRRMRRGRKS